MSLGTSSLYLLLPSRHDRRNRLVNGVRRLRPSIPYPHHRAIAVRRRRPRHVDVLPGPHRAAETGDGLPASA